MKNFFWFIASMVYSLTIHAQSIEDKLQKAVQQFEKDSQMRHAILGFAVADAATGKLIYERNAQIGLAPASTQKIITSIAAFELLGHDYRYTTELLYNGPIENGVLNGHLHVKSSGDPSFGSWRYAGTRDTMILGKWADAVLKKGIQRIKGGLLVIETLAHQAIPDGWIWQDIGNYYGAGAYELNWKENQYDVILQSGNTVGDGVTITKAGSKVLKNKYNNALKTAGKGTGDNAYIYFQLAPGRNPSIAGTIPVGEKSFSISGATPDPVAELQDDVVSAFSAASIRFDAINDEVWSQALRTRPSAIALYKHVSPPLESLNYWFMRRSINLYGEAFVQTIAYEKAKVRSTDTGIRVIRDFWAGKGIDKAALNIIDGSGLSPQNRLTADALVRALQYAKARPWRASFYESLPTFNGMKLKSGSIGGARAFAGYHTSAQGKEYIIAIIVNNYAGSSGDIIRKMYRVLDELK
ncbi:MAG TPA: D-alanyl-D-alanine carboxypeptidase/D-alanyl-D-alanine-endopeptidase [Chitinophagaceae bacterium]|nr:D-alanyl-D-alanine carboxypeptidase/D-alanyl-D-alanine-endopeptidase [Chitinophagaceae bacterium]